MDTQEAGGVDMIAGQSFEVIVKVTINLALRAVSFYTILASVSDLAVKL